MQHERDHQQMNHKALSLAEQEAYWLKTLYGDVVNSDAWLDHPRPATQLFFHETITRHEPIRSDELKSIALQTDSDVLALLLAAWSIVFLRHTEQQQCIIGTIAPDCQRIHKGVQETFCNPLPVRISTAADPTVSTFVQKVTAQLAESRVNRDFPFEQIVSALHVPLEAARAPLFQIMTVFLNQPTQLGRPLTRKDMDAVKAYCMQCDMVLLASIEDDELLLQCDYDSTLFEASTIHTLLAHFCLVLRQSGDDSRISELQLGDREEREYLLADTFYPRHPFPLQHFPAYLSTWAEQQPDEPALLEGDTVLSYYELAQRVEHMAAYLLEAGSKRGDVIAVYLERGIDSIIAMLGALKAGCSYLPLDTVWPHQRLAYILEDTRAPFLITRQDLLKDLPLYQGRSLVLEHVTEGTGATVELPTESEPACILYTSGSTGRPKGVVLTHRMISNLISWHAAQYPEKRRVLQFSSSGFDQMLHEMGAAWANGGSLVIVPQAVKEDIPELAQFLLTFQIERAFLPVVVAQRLAEILLQKQQMLPYLREVITTGEQLIITQSLRDFFSLSRETKLINHYGPTETHVVTAYQMEDDPENWPVVPPIGCAIENVQTLVLTGNLELAPLGVWGELYLAGDCLAQRYWNDPQLTAARFLPHPFATQPGQRMYKTGDRVRYRFDGQLEFAGRLDNQLKIRGYRVEPGEIEAVLAEHSEVRTAIVLPAHQDQTIRLIAYIVPVHTTLQESELRRYLGLLLPAYMIPTTFVMLEALPLNANGKVDRQLLPQPEVMGEAPLAHPGNAIEQKLVAIWQDILHVPQIGIHDNFFALGGHSLLGAQLISRLRQEYHVELTQFDVFSRPTVAGLAGLIEGVLLLAETSANSDEMEEEIEF